MSGNVGRYLRSRQGAQTTATQNDGVELPQDQPIALRQLVDLVDLPVHQLPDVQCINLLPLPAYLLPNKLSKDGLASAVPLSSSSPLSDCLDLKHVETSGFRPIGLLEYAPTD
ncbi:hypothetical protein PHET_05656 [Paragonimus heterotremus]|uniref:Uncharacterized protein n=1 Tax=Paragonimus heterotremus TaxID=100268 RepID=A0A8J4SKK4_9TREM|nr:hypothetical protein PHET_05656 [Paragonimus heterotremus]